MPKNKKFELSKTDYLAYKDCPKLLWFHNNSDNENETEQDDHSFESNRRIRIGKEVGRLARSYFGKYVKVQYDDFQKMCYETDEYIKQKEKIIAEASFYYDGYSCQVDILKSTGTQYDIIEVKSAASVKDEYYDDCAFQYYVLSSKGIPIKNIYLMHINNEYIRDGDIDIKLFFKLENITKDVKNMQKELIEKLNRLRRIVNNKNEPKIDIEPKCIDCDYNEQCGIKLPKYNIFTIRGRGISDDKKWELFENGIISYKHLLQNNYPLNDNQRMQVESEVKKLPLHIDKNEIKSFLKELSYPLYFLDFETYDTVIPDYDGMYPYMKVPFQFSLHILNKKKGKLEHKEFLADIDKDPRRLLAEKLCEYIPEKSCVLAYHMTFEKGVIDNLAKTFKDLSKHFLKINDNMKDLEIPFRKRYYYCRTMEGSSSIKKVLPALLPPKSYPELDYNRLKKVKNGADAMNLYPELKYLSEKQIKKYRRCLLEYCRLDTLAMVRILEKLETL